MAPTNFFNANTGLLETALSELFATDADVAAEESRAVGVEQQLGAAVTNLNTATNSLNTRADALETSTGTLNTAVATLNTATGSLNTAVGSLQTNTLKLAGGIMEGPATNEYGWYGAFTGDGGGLTNLTAPAATNSDALGGQSAATWVAATGSLNSVVANILTATGALNSAVADLQTSTGALNSAVVQLQTDTGTIWTAVGTLNTATNDLNGRVTDLEGGGDAAGWSGFAATQEVYWSYATPIVTTNIVVTGSGLEPDVAGTYTYGGVNMEGYNYWGCTNGYYIYVPSLFYPQYTIWTAYNGYPGDDDFFYKDSDNENPVGNYLPYIATGTPVAVYAYITNTYEWKAGPAPDDGQAWKLTLGGTNIYRAYGTSNVFDKPLYGDGSGLTNLTALEATNATALGGQSAATWAAATNSNNSRVDNLETNAYQAFTASVIPDDGGTCTITTAHGNLVKIHQDNFSPATNAITLTIPTNGFFEGGVNRIGVELYFTGSVGFVTATITNSTGLTISTTATNSLFFRRTMNGNLWTVRQ